MSNARASNGGITIGNGSFENITATVSAPSSFLGVTIVGSNTNNFGLWTAIAGSTVVGLTPISIAVGTATSLGGPTPLNGTYDARISLGAGLGNYISLSQTLSTSFQPNCSYNLSLDLDAGVNVSLLAQSSLQLQAGSTTVASLSGSSLVSLLDTTPGFQTLNLNYVTGASAPTGNIQVVFKSSSVLGLGGNVYLDDAALNVSTVPEPRASLLLGGGFGMLMAINRFRKKSA